MADLEANILIKILDAFTAPIRKLTDGLGDTEHAADRARKAFAFAADLNQSAEAVGRFGEMLIGPLKGAVEEFATFDQALSRLSAMSEQARGSVGFEAMRAEAEKLGAQTEYSSEEVAALMTEFSQANFSWQEILKVTGTTLSAAAAGGLGLAETADIVSGALRGMQLPVSETEHVIDVLSVAAVKSGANLRGMSDALSYVAPLAAKAGMSIESTAAMIGVLSDAQIKGSQAGTGLRAVLASLAEPSKDARRGFAAMGIGAEKLREMQKQLAAGNLSGALKQIGEATKELPNEKQLELMSRVFGREAATAAQVLITANLEGGSYEKLRKELDNVKGKTDEMAKVMRDNLAGAFERAGGAISGMNTSIGKALAPSAHSAADAVEKLAGGLGDFAKDNPKAVAAIGDLMLGIAGMTFVIKGFLLAKAAYISAMGLATSANVKFSGSSFGHLGLIAAAATAGVLVGTWANETFELDDKISSLLGRPRPGGGEVNKEVSVYAGGWEVNNKTGQVVKMGEGPAPLSIRRVQARGAQTEAEINTVIAMDRSREAKKGFRVAPEAPSRVPSMLEAQNVGSPLAQLAPTAAMEAAEIKRQTDLQLEMVRTAKRTADALERIERRREMERLTGTMHGL